MTIWNLINTVSFGSSKLKSGAQIDDNAIDTTAIANAGGLLVQHGTMPIVDAAALVVLGWWKSGSRSPESCDATMLAAYGLAGQAYEMTHDTVVTATTGVAVVNGTTGATVSSGSFPRTMSGSVSLQAAGVTVHATDVGGAALNLIAAFTNPLPRRTLNIARSNAGPANVDYTCYYNDPLGVSHSVVLTVPKNNNATTLVAGEWTRITTAVDPVSTSIFTTGTGFCVGDVILAANTPVVSTNGVVAAPTTTDLPSGTIVPATVPDGAKEFVVHFLSGHAHSLVDAGHVHAVTDAGHTHAMS